MFKFLKKLFNIDQPVLVVAPYKVEAPVVNAPVVNAPVVNAPVVNAPVVNAPVVNAPVVNAPVVNAVIKPITPVVKKHTRKPRSKSATK